jgi:hypothetical protein
MEYSGKADNSSIEAVVNFSGYNEFQEVTKPTEYFIESELIN